MTKNNGEAHEPDSALARSGIDRRGFFRGAALLGGLSATGLLPAFEPRRALAAEPEQITGATAALAAQTQRILRWAGPAATVSFNALMGDVTSMVLQPQLIDAISRDLFVEGIDVAVNKRFVDMPQSPPDPAPYQNAIRS